MTPAQALGTVLLTLRFLCGSDTAPLAGSLPPEPDMMLHKNGSITLTIDGTEHLIPPRRFRTKAAELLAGERAIVFRMEVWDRFEHDTVVRFPILYKMGVRRVTVKCDVTGEEEIQVWNLGPSSLRERIADNDPAVRKAAFNQIAAMLESENTSDRANAMDTLRDARRVRVDQARFLPLVRRSLDATSSREAWQAIRTIVQVGGDENDIPKLLEYVDHENSWIRASLCNALCALDPTGEHPGVGPAIERLLDDPSGSVRSSTYKSLWRGPSTPGIDQRLVALSRTADEPRRRGADDVIRYALTRRPLIRRPVAERLIELIHPKSNHTSRAIWGLSHHQATDNARPTIVEALIGVIDTEIEGEIRNDAIHGLGLHGGDEAVQKLEAIATNPLESKKTRELAGESLQRLGRPIPIADDSPPAPLKSDITSSDKPKQLWEQIVQPRDPELRKTALDKAAGLLEHEETAVEALTALARARDAEFNRKPFAPLVRPYLTSTNEELRAQAFGTMSTLGDGAIGIAQIAACLDDDSPLVRQNIAEALFRVDPEAKHPATSETIERLLADPDRNVVRATLYQLWARPTSAAAEETLLDLSYDLELGEHALYHAVTTRPLIRKPVAERLLEQLALTRRDMHENRFRAIWALSENPATADARDMVVDALAGVVDIVADGHDREMAIQGLARHGGPKARQKLQAIIDDPHESEIAKQQAREATQQLG
jgi:HEAT repeat protein